MQFLHQLLLDPGFRYNAEHVRKSFSIVMSDNPNRMRVGIPPEWLFLNRVQWGPEHGARTARRSWAVARDHRVAANRADRAGMT